jgi:hypothetical protein
MLFACDAGLFENRLTFKIYEVQFFLRDNKND